jgi:hypothetical protein
MCPKLLACECIEVAQPVAFRGAVVVFRGRVEQVEHMTLVESVDPRTGEKVLRPPETSDHTVVTFKVSAVWKGPARQVLKVHATAKAAICSGYAFEEGREYVVYATDPLNPSWDKLQRIAKGMRVFDVADCPLRVRTDVKEESGILGKGRPPQEK